ncbi:MAG: prenyltransferase/squalene oxidase repeat-containing protein [Planctomycetales bacterium]
MLVLGLAALAGRGAEVRPAVERGLAQVSRAASNWPKNKTCFSCHHQTLPMLAAVEARRAGVAVSAEWLKAQAQITHEYFAERIDDMDEGDHVPGGAATAAYGLWALALDQRTADQTTTSIVTYLLQIQGVQRLKSSKPSESAKPKDGRWIASCRRAPMQASEIGDTVLVLLGLERFATADQREKVSEARAAAEKFLAAAPMRSLQDRLWRFWGLQQMGGDEARKAVVRAEILKRQLPDGGWGQTDEDTDSDAYSTGQTIFMLCRSGVSPEDPAMARARDFLLRTQLDDGSWLVVSRLKFKAQPYFENGDPHGEHQFLSTAATAWATAGLAQLLAPAVSPAR